MATLVLSAVGTAVAGPFGGMLGAIAGRTIDSQVFGIGNRRVEGPRKDDLSVQSAAFGRPIPLVYGAGRYAGNVLWSTGLVEKREEESQGGKGGPSVTNVTYSYSASFAVGLCAGPIHDVGRVWADGKLIRDVGGSLAVGGTMRAYLGDEDQAPDTLLEGDIGLGQTPAFRGTAYCVFESLELAEFGNRIPNLSFEVFTHAASDSSPACTTVAADLLERAGLPATAQGSADTVTGYSVSGGQSLRDGLNELLDVFDLKVLATSAGAIVSPPSASAVASFDTGSLGVEVSSGPAEHFSMDYDHAADVPEEMGLGYADPASDYQDGLQRAQSAGVSGTLSAQRLNSALVLETGDARALVTKMLTRTRHQRASIQFRIGLPGARLEPGDVISISGDLPMPLSFQIDQVVEEGLVRTISAAALPEQDSAAYSNFPATSGQAAYAQSVGTPTLAARVFELPATRQFGNAPAVYASCARLGGRISSAGLYISVDGGVDYALAATLPVSGVHGICVTGLPDRMPSLIDRASTLEVALDHADMELFSRPWLAILNGANLAMVGTELIQFENASQTETGTYLLTGLLRGRGGTENTLMGTAAGQPFTLLQSGDLGKRSFGVSDLGTSVTYKIVPPGQSLTDVAAQTHVFEGRALRPLAPVHVKAAYDASAGLSLSWVRRSRSGYGWLDGVDASLDETSEGYRVTYASGANSISRDVTTPSDQLSPAELSAAFGAGPYTLDITISQLSDTLGPGDPAAASVAIPA
ncbi:MAG: phage tail protein [Pseudomonadota bacterium]